MSEKSAGAILASTIEKIGATTAVGTYETIITFEESTCFAETTYNVNYNINKIQSGTIINLRYAHGEGQYINVTSTGFVADAWGNYEPNRQISFYDETMTMLIGETLDSAKFEIEITPGVWVKLTGNFSLLVTEQVHDLRQVQDQHRDDGDPPDRYGMIQYIMYS